MAISNSDKKLNVIGRALVYLDKWSEFIQNKDAVKEFVSPENLWTPYLHELNGRIPGVNLGTITDDYKYDSSKRDLLSLCEYINEFYEHVNMPFSLIYPHEVFCIVAYGGKYYIIPSSYVKYELFEDYTNYTVSEIRSDLLNGKADNCSETTLLPADLNSSTLSTQQERITHTYRNIADLKSQMEAVKNAKTPELAAIQAEIDKYVAKLEAKKNAMLSALQAKENELNTMMADLKQQLFILESEIYSIRCYLGEVVDFIPVRKGKSAPVDVPVTLFQKLRYMDEELGKMASIYEVDFSDVKLFEKLIKYNDECFETFCPNDKCITLVRVSKSNIGYSSMETVFGPILDVYKKYHGMTIGILIRDGENLYMGWTDDAKISIEDDFFYTPETRVLEEDDAIKQTTPEEFVSRYFLFSILQGVLENTDMITLPEICSVFKPSKYIIYSAADNWLCDNRFGSFEDILNKTQNNIKVGNMVLMWEYLSDGYLEGMSSFYRHCYRDRNYSRRTKDTRVKSGSIEKINLIEYEELKHRYTYNSHGTIYNTYAKPNDPPKFAPEVEVISVEDYREPIYYVSLRKECSDWEPYYDGEYHERKREARANFRVYTEEFIDLTYLNTVWLKYVITTRNLGNHSRDDKRVNYAHMIKFLNIALQHVTLREQEERNLIIKYYPELDNVSDWPVLLSEWKLTNNVSVITEYQAKRFAKTIV